jgi:hypothetical protein
MMRQTANPLSGISVIKRVATIRSRKTKVSAGLHGGDILKNKLFNEKKNILRKTKNFWNLLRCSI